MGLLFTPLGMGFTGDDKGCNKHLKIIGLGRGITGDTKGDKR